MKRLFLIVLIALVVSLGTIKPAYADEGDLYAGVKTGIMLIDVPYIDDVTAVGLLFGAGVAPKVSVEGEFNVSISGDELDIWTLAAYGVYRHPILDNVSLKGKVGFLFESVSIDIDTIFGRYSKDGTDFGSSFGAGVTVGITDVLSAEVEYTVIEVDVAYLSVGLNYKF